MIRLPSPPPAVEKVWGWIRSAGLIPKLIRAVAMGVAFIVAVKLYFNPPLGIFLYGVATGALYGLLAVGIILVYRTNRIINFAAAAIGATPAIAAVLLGVLKGWPYAATLPVVLIGSTLVGAVVDFTIIRRFASAPRLIVTVATIGISQILAFIGIYIPIWLGSQGKLQSVIETPWKKLLTWRKSNGDILLTGDHVFALIVVFGVSIGLAAFFRYTRVGIALRASAENADRASLLGIPVRRIGTVAWALAGLLAGITIFLRAPLAGVPVDGSLGYAVLVYALAAAVIAKMDNVILAIFAGMAVGILEQASVVKTGANNFATAMMLVVILAALLLQRKSLSRAYDAGTSTWQSVKEFRPIPTELRNMREVWIAKAVFAVLVFVLFAAAPWIVGASKVPKLTSIPLDAIVAVSLVILVGWAGQISLGQFGLVGISAGVIGGLAANHNIDFFLAIILGALLGAFVSLLIGLPALRVQGLYLAVATLAFAAAVEGYVLRPDFLGKHFLPRGSNLVTPPVLWQRIDTNTPIRFYFLSLTFLGLAILCARSFRKNRSGRVLIAVRDNQRAAPAYAINLASSKLAAFAISGALAAVAGVLIAYQQTSIDQSPYGMIPSVKIFIYTVVGGLTSVGGAVAGAIIFGLLSLFGDDLMRGLSFLSTGVGVLVILLFLPGGLAELFFKWRDNFLRWVANRHDILVPSLVADKLVVDEKEQAGVIEAAEQHVEEVESFDIVNVPEIMCPVCAMVLTLDQAATHEHLRADGHGDQTDGNEDWMPEPVGATNGGGGRRRLGRARSGRR